MACVKPLLIKNPLYMKTHIKEPIKFEPLLQVPCNWCLNCRIDKRNWIVDSANYWWKKHKKASYITLTYCNEALVQDCKEFNKEGNITFSCRMKHGIDFIKRVREYLRRHGLYDSTFAKKNNKYIIATEYGETKDRPHIHIVWLGLDYEKLDKIYRKLWKKGFITNLPLQKGGIRYVSKYLDKQIKGSEAKKIFAENNMEEPKLKHSIGMGDEFIKKNLQDIMQNYGTYEVKPGTRRPIPHYWANKYCINTFNPFKNKEITREMEENYQIKKNKFYTKEEIEKFKRRKSIRRHNLLAQKMRDEGSPAIIIDERQNQTNLSTYNFLKDYKKWIWTTNMEWVENYL